MIYIQVKLICDPNTEVVKDVLSVMLADIGFETFEQTEAGLDAYVPQSEFTAEKIDGCIAAFPMEATIKWDYFELEDKNWNEEWERNYFQPIVIDDICCIYSSFHRPDKTYPYHIMINPKMAFGTGHHQTTGLILKEILGMDISGKSVLDMGCGTAVLAILSSMRGADHIVAIDIDAWAYKNARENVQLNGIDNIEVLEGGAELLDDQSFNVILANINRNILLRDIPFYDKVLNRCGLIVMSGFYREDVPAIRARGVEMGWTHLHTTEMDQWVAVTFAK